MASILDGSVGYGADGGGSASGGGVGGAVALPALPAPSTAQAAVVAAVLRGHNVVCTAVAGAGKTTTQLQIISSLRSDDRVLIVCYNRKLREDSLRALAGAGPTLKPDVLIHTFHSLFKFFFGAPGLVTDAHLISWLKAPVPSARRVLRDKPFSHVFVDEAQDLTSTLLSFLLQLLAVHQPHRWPLFAVLGDEKQAIYGFKGADAAFMNRAEAVMPSPLPWQRLRLGASNRITTPMAAFLNVGCGMRALNKDSDYITAQKDGKPVELWVGNPFEIAVSLGGTVRGWLEKRMYQPGDVYVLAPSVRGANVKARVDSLDRRTPLQLFVDELQKGTRSVLVEVVDHGGDGGGGSGKDALEKVLVSTIHQAKGGQRRMAIVWGFTPHPRDPPLAELSNEWYVALTRAWEKLVVVAGAAENMLPFLDLEALSTENIKRVNGCGTAKGFVDVHFTDSDTMFKLPHAAPAAAVLTEDPNAIPSTRLLSFVPESTLERALAGLVFTPLARVEEEAHIQLDTSRVDSPKYYGVALPAMLEASTFPPPPEPASEGGAPWHCCYIARKLFNAEVSMMLNQFDRGMLEDWKAMRAYEREHRATIHVSPELHVDWFFQVAVMFTEVASLNAGFWVLYRQTAANGFAFMTSHAAALCLSRMRAATQVAGAASVSFEFELERPLPPPAAPPPSASLPASSNAAAERGAAFPSVAASRAAAGGGSGGGAGAGIPSLDFSPALSQHSLSSSPSSSLTNNGGSDTPFPSPRRLQGILDVIVTGGDGALTVWELKCKAGELSALDKAQLALYAWIMRGQPADAAAPPRRVTFRLLNVRSGELWALDDDAPEEALQNCVAALLAHYDRKPRTRRDDDAFLQEPAQAGLLELARRIAAEVGRGGGGGDGEEGALPSSQLSDKDLLNACEVGEALEGLSSAELSDLGTRAWAGKRPQQAELPCAKRKA